MAIRNRSIRLGDTQVDLMSEDGNGKVWRTKPYRWAIEEDGMIAPFTAWGGCFKIKDAYEAYYEGRVSGPELVAAFVTTLDFYGEFMDSKKVYFALEEEEGSGIVFIIHT